MRNKRVYISGGMSGIPNFEKNFNRAENYLKVFDYFPFNPLKWNKSMIDYELSYLEMMKIDLTYLLMCDTIYMLKDWEQSEGACAELYVALYNGKRIKFEGEKDDIIIDKAKLEQQCIDNMIEKITLEDLLKMGVVC